MANSKNLEIVFAWFPVWTEAGKLVWLTKVKRSWNENKNFSVLMADDPGEYLGGWDYFSI